MCAMVTIVTLIFLSASKLFITGVLMGKENMSGSLFLTLSGLEQINAYGIRLSIPQLGTSLSHP